MRILVVEDDDRIADFLARALRSEGHHCVRCDNGRDGLSLALEGEFDLIILDLMLPGLHGLEVCQELRMRKKMTPVIMLTAMDGLDDVVTGLRMGADDYMKKPMALEELFARIDTVTRRGKNDEDPQECMRLRDIEFNRRSLQVTLAGELVDLTAKEIAILELLISNPGKLFSRERILSSIWGMHMDPLTNVVDVYIGKLRRKIDRDRGESIIETVRGLGYRMRVS